MPVFDWCTGARSGWTGSSAVGVHKRVLKGWGIRLIPLGACVCVCLSD